MHYGLWIGGGVSAILAVGIALVIRALRALERELKARFSGNPEGSSIEYQTEAPQDRRQETTSIRS